MKRHKKWPLYPSTYHKMDVDNGPPEAPVPGTIDIEQSLLQQFSCMGTTDKEELVQQLQKLLGSHLNYTTAAFFLDMNNWNLQAAICSYLDIESSNQLPSMALVSNPLANETESIEPNVSFQKTWHVCNNGTETWPVGCYAQCSDGDKMGGNRVPVPSLQPGEGMHLSVNMTGPSVPDPMWAIVTVVEEGTIALTQQLSHFNELGALPSPTSGHNPFIPHRTHTENSQESAPPDDSKMW
ncbi:hypothetical protein NQ315_008683 [Exocentrus adspersus]|uniref:Nbr1 FW domain-containing protein n=1 Tax=Exocentrus adspersus TaxID=1586481 RepID=A0AAV8W5V8_9CUCU|nr:hypothetical protein NQ315_008683 [Exocentrus adspersus]